jgi:hypothetical protein
MLLRFKPSLQHLIMQPITGLCGRLRAVASAIRFSELHRISRLTVAWDVGRHLFDPDMTLFDWIVEANSKGIKDFHPYLKMTSGIRHRPRENIKAILSSPTLYVNTSYVFPFVREDYATIVRKSCSFLPPPRPDIRLRIDQFRGTYFNRTVGMHMRRTDQLRSIVESPNSAFFREAETLIDQGKTIFLATDNEESSEMMKKKFGSNIITFPKSNPTLVRRWPRRQEILDDWIEDFIDLHLLATCEYVLGSRHSAYTSVAMALNRSPKSRVVV